MKNKKNLVMRTITTLIVLLLIVPFGSIPTVKAQSSTSLLFFPSSSVALTCTDFILTLRVEDVEDLYAYDIWLNFTPGSIDILDVSNGTFLTTGRYYFRTFNNSTGQIHVAMTQINPALPKDGSGDLISIRLRAKTPGASITWSIGAASMLTTNLGQTIAYTGINDSMTTAVCPPAELSLYPNYGVACVGVDTTVFVKVDKVWDLFSYTLDLTIDPSSAINITNVFNAGFLEDGLFEMTNDYDNSFIQFGMSQISTAPPKDGSGNLIGITFNALTPGLVVNVNFDETGIDLLNWPLVQSIPFTATDGVIYTSTCDPNAVELLSFDVVRKKLKAFLSWETASELDLAGFNIYRSGFVDGTLKKINKEFIPAKEVGSLTGAEYAYLDFPLKPWKTYYYWLETVEMNGETSLTGPIKAARPKK